jgi:tetratricopeptide (TPR) repeat protein
LKRFSLFFLLGIFNLFPAAAQPRLETALHLAVTTGTDFILRQEYRQADSLFQHLAKTYPQHPAGYLYQAAVMQAEAMDFMVPVDRTRFESFLELGRKAAKNISSPWKEYFLGTADGYDAYERMDRGDWLGGINKGMSSVSGFEDVISQDSSFYDAYVGAGTYYYWRSEKTKSFNWLPFVKDRRARGIEMLKLGAEHSEYNRFAAISGLISILLDAQDYNAVVKWSRLGLAAYPNNRTFLWGLATALDRGKKPQEAVSAYQILLHSLQDAHAPHAYNEVVCRLNLAKCQLAMGDTVHARGNLHALLNFRNAAFPSALTDRAKAKFEEADKILFSANNNRTNPR